MKRLLKNFLYLIVVFISVFNLYGCGTESAYNHEKSHEEQKLIDEKMRDLSVWVAYWQLDVNEEIKALDTNLTSVSYFEAYFNGENNIIIPKELLDYYEATKDADYHKYITFVNDVIIDKNHKSLKDVNLLQKLLDSKDSTKAHIEELITIAKQYGFDGIEIDYEQLKNNMDLWNKFYDFIEELYKRTKEEGLKLRVVLEPSLPYEQLTFVEGPEYVIMCYNLHGSADNPGEKANEEFICEIIDKTKNVPENKKFAVATGGIDWQEGEKGNSIDEKTAIELINKYNPKIRRDEKSHCIVFEYDDENNCSHEVWYADKHTLNRWLGVIYDKGYTGALWKLGGNAF